jgi:hypothetical protein
VTAWLARMSRDLLSILSRSPVFSSSASAFCASGLIVPERHYELKIANLSWYRNNSVKLGRIHLAALTSWPARSTTAARAIIGTTFKHPLLPERCQWHGRDMGPA